MKKYGLIVTRKKGKITEKLEEHKDGNLYMVDEVDRCFKEMVTDCQRQIKLAGGEK